MLQDHDGTVTTTQVAQQIAWCEGGLLGLDVFTNAQRTAIPCPIRNMQALWTIRWGLQDDEQRATVIGAACIDARKKGYRP
ncbi:MAG: hypothetical protein CMJ21_06245 [Phycisphaerae bacterium]|jgi:hypothetical protein|nr:hypothetical protein [Phycisphaerae bacterium]